MDDDIFRGVGVEISLPNPDNFLKIKETLTRIGIASRKEKKLYQSCHILHKRSRYAIVHFKELFILDGRIDSFTQEDEGRRNTIADLLEQWGLLEILDDQTGDLPFANTNQVKVISFKEKGEWNLETKYTIGTRING